jgi:hypothetical protein
MGEQNRIDKCTVLPLSLMREMSTEVSKKWPSDKKNVTAYLLFSRAQTTYGIISLGEEFFLFIGSVQ